MFVLFQYFAIFKLTNMRGEKMFKAKMVFEVIGSTQGLKKVPFSMYKMVDQGKGVVKFGKEKYYLRNIQTVEQYKRNVGAAAVGGIAGGLLLGGVGLLAGGALGGRRKDDNSYIITLQDIKSGEVMDVQAKVPTGGKTTSNVNQFSIYGG